VAVPLQAVDAQQNVSASSQRHKLTPEELQVEDSVAGPYAAGILELAQERDILDEVYGDLMGLQVLTCSVKKNVAARC
jgi:hypothetical protein